MIIHQNKHRVWFKTIALVMVCLFTVNNVVWACPNISSSKSTLAVPSQLTKDEFKNKVKNEYLFLAHIAFNDYIKQKILEAGGFDKLSQREDTIDGKIEIIVAAIPDLFTNRGIFAHVGLGKHNGKPVIYVDSHFFYDEEKIAGAKSDIQKDCDEIVKHDKNEISKWASLGMPLSTLREQYITEDPIEAKRIAVRFHSESNNINHLYEKYGDRINWDEVYGAYLKYGLDSEDKKDVAIAAAKISETLLERPTEIAILGGDVEIIPIIHGFSNDGMISEGESLKVITPFAYDGGNFAAIQEDVRKMWERKLSVRIIEFLENNVPFIANIIKNFLYNVCGIILIKTLPTGGAFIDGFGAGYSDELYEKVLTYRTEEKRHAVDAIEEARKAAEEAGLNISTAKAKEFFDTLTSYAKIVDERWIGIERKPWQREAETIKPGHFVDLTGQYSEGIPGEAGRKAASVQNILYLGIMAKATGNGWISLKQYRKAIDELAKVLNAPSVAIHSSLNSHIDAKIETVLEAEEDIEIPYGSRTVNLRTNILDGQFAAKTFKHKSKVKAVSFKGNTALLRALPETIKVINEAEEVVIIAENFFTDLVTYLSIPAVKKALIERKKAGKSTILVMPPTTKDGTPSVLDLRDEDIIKRATGCDISTVVTSVLIDNIEMQPEYIKKEAMLFLESVSAEPVKVTNELIKDLFLRGVLVLHAPIGEMREELGRLSGMKERSGRYQIAPNRLAFALRLFRIYHEGELPVWATDLDGTLKGKWQEPMPEPMALEVAKCINAGAPVSYITGGPFNLVWEKSAKPTFDQVARIGAEDKSSLLIVQAVAGGLNFICLKDLYDLVEGVNIAERIGKQKFDKLKEIFAELTVTVKKDNVERNFTGENGSGFWGSCFDDRTAGVTFAVLGKDAPQEIIDRYPERTDHVNPLNKYLDFLTKRCKEEGIDITWKVGSKVHVDGTLPGMTKKRAIEVLAKLLNVPARAIFFSGDSIRKVKNRPGNDTSAAEAAGFSLNADGMNIDGVKERPIITTTEPGSNLGMLPFVIIYRCFYEQVVPENRKKFVTTLRNNVSNYKATQAKLTPENVTGELTEFLNNPQEIAIGDVWKFIRYVDVIIENGNESQLIPAYRVLCKLFLLEAANEPLVALNIENRLRLLTRERMDKDRIREYESQYQSGQFSEHNNLDGANDLVAAQNYAITRSNVSLPLRGNMENGKIGYLIFAGEELKEKDLLSLDKQFEVIRTLQAEQDAPVSICIITSSLTHNKVVSHLKKRNFYGIPLEQIDVDFQGNWHSFNANSRRHYYFRTNKKHLYPPGNLEGLFSAALRNGTLPNWLENGVSNIIATSIAEDISMQECHFALQAVNKGAEAAVFVSERRKDMEETAIYARRGQLELRPDYAVPEQQRGNLVFRFPAALSLRTLFEKVQAESGGWTQRIEGVTKKCRHYPYIIEKRVDERGQRISIHQFRWPFSNITNVLKTVYLYPTAGVNFDLGGSSQKGSPAKLLGHLRDHPTLLQKARSINGITLSEANENRPPNQKTGEPYKTKTQKLEFELLIDLGIFIPINGDLEHCRFSDMMLGANENYTKILINVINEVKFKVGKKGNENPLHRGNIPKEERALVREILKLHITDYIHTHMKEVQTTDKPYVIKAWEGYGAPSQRNLLTQLKKITENKPYQVSFEKIVDLVEFACNSENINNNTVTILPYNMLNENQITRLRETSARVIYINLDREQLDADDLTPLEGLIAVGRAYLVNDEMSFYRLYELLTQSKDYTPIALDALKDDPLLFVEALRFVLKPITVHDPKELERIRERMKELLIAA